ncbi:hypothetical protein EYF80_023931 [Liparis tanakae]|uniref:Uncharacterized protein n=1 Tax=Liparis tanakae TaxID=230148 RepID=A0A4Z2HIN7_9TELE|nr:hypothetical protein EYF80_023931 [Liparis tanakae]
MGGVTGEGRLRAGEWLGRCGGECCGCPEVEEQVEPGDGTEVCCRREEAGAESGGSTYDGERAKGCRDPPPLIIAPTFCRPQRAQRSHLIIAPEGASPEVLEDEARLIVRGREARWCRSPATLPSFVEKESASACQHRLDYYSVFMVPSCVVRPKQRPQTGNRRVAFKDDLCVILTGSQTPTARLLLPLQRGRFVWSPHFFGSVPFHTRRAERDENPYVLYAARALAVCCSVARLSQSDTATVHRNETPVESQKVKTNSTAASDQTEDILGYID